MDSMSGLSVIGRLGVTFGWPCWSAQKRGGHEMLLTASLHGHHLRNNEWKNLGKLTGRDRSLGRYSRRRRLILLSNDGLTGQRWLVGSVVLWDQSYVLRLRLEILIPIKHYRVVANTIVSSSKTLKSSLRHFYVLLWIAKGIISWQDPLLFHISRTRPRPPSGLVCWLQGSKTCLVFHSTALSSSKLLHLICFPPSPQSLSRILYSVDHTSYHSLSGPSGISSVSWTRTLLWVPSFFSLLLTKYNITTAQLRLFRSSFRTPNPYFVVTIRWTALVLHVG